MKQIAVFTLNGCEMCWALKKRLKDESIPFHDIEITLNRDIWESVLKQTGEDAVPTVFIQTDDKGNGLIYSPGRDYFEIDEVVDAIKHNI